jgi:hypothetical protein
MLSPIDDELINTSATIFADDAGATVTGDSIEQLTLNDTRDDKTFDKHHLIIGLRQNTDKAVRQIKLFGEGATKINRAAKNNDNKIGDKVYVSEARYLGPYLHIENTFDNEMVRRIAAMSRAFWLWRKFWHSVAPAKLRILIFRALIVSLLFSCVTAYALNEKHYRIMQGAVCKLLRRFLRGQAVTEKDDGTKKIHLQCSGSLSRRFSSPPHRTCHSSVTMVCTNRT